jgi:hypothetical protein
MENQKNSAYKKNYLKKKIFKKKNKKKVSTKKNLFFEYELQREAKKKEGYVYPSKLRETCFE